MGTADYKGFTLLELMVTVAVASVTLLIAIPSYQSVVARNAVVAGVNDLVGDLNYARSEAVDRGQHVYVCPSTDQTSCRSKGKNDWADGWIVFAPDPEGSSVPDDDNILRVHDGIKKGISLDGCTSRVRFNSSGFATGSNCSIEATDDNSAMTSKVVISNSGRVRIDQGD